MKPGDWVWCVNDQWPNRPDLWYCPMGYPVEGAAYQVSDVYEPYDRDGYSGIIIDGMPCFFLRSGAKVVFAANRFQKISEPVAGDHGPFILNPETE